MLPTKIQILVLAPFSRFYRIYRRYALNGKRRSRRRRDVIGDFGNLQIYRCSVLDIIFFLLKRTQPHLPLVFFLLCPPLDSLMFLFFYPYLSAANTMVPVGFSLFIATKAA
jgi:hypothetical protein